MNTDDTFKKNSGDNHHSGLTPELEVRVVAWVLGEATPAEAAELERLCAANAVLAEFKRRIEAVHGLVGAAARPVNDAALRLSDERRAKVLAVIGEDAAGAGGEADEDAVRPIPRWVQVWNQWALPAAACITLCVLLGAVLFPAVGAAKKSAQRAQSIALAREMEQRKLLEMEESRTPMGSSGAIVNSVVDNSVSSEEAPMVAFDRDVPVRDASVINETERRVRVSRSNAPVGAAAMPVPVAAPAPMSMNGTDTLTLSGGNTYSGGTVVTSGALSLGSTDGISSEVRYRKQLRGQEQQLLATDAQENVTSSAPATAASSVDGMSFSGEVAAAEPQKANQPMMPLFGFAEAKKDVGKDQWTDSGSGAVGGARGNAAPAVRFRQQNEGSLSVGGTVVAGQFQDASKMLADADVAGDTGYFDKGQAIDGLKSKESKDLSFKRSELNQAVLSSAPPPVTLSSSSSVTFNFNKKEVEEDDAKRFEPWDSPTQPRRKRSSVTITAGTPQTFESIVFTKADQAEIARRLALRKAERLKNQSSTSGIKGEQQPIFKATREAATLFGYDSPEDFEDHAAVIREFTDEIKAIEAKADAQAKRTIDESLRAETATNQQPVSTFSLHVSDASFRIAKAALARGEAPDPASIRPEEFYNAFDYGDPSPVAGEPVACRIEQSAHPFLQQRNLVRIAMKVPATGRGAGQPLRLTVLLDTSGSMERADRAASVRAALTSLVSLLGPDDRITLVGFARQPHLLADRVPGNQAAGLADLVAKTPFEGGTNLEEALKLAGNCARGQFTASAQNRIVLLTDGAANLGEDDPARLAAMIAALRQQGIAFDACGVGADGLDDTILEALTRKGDGRYTVINSPEEADAGFAHTLAGAFRPAAQNVKVQVRFNPSRVARYRLIGFEQHRLKTEDFRNDRVDAAELAAEEAAVALYQVEVLPDGEGELGEVFVRFRDVATGGMVERSWTLAYAPQPSAFDRATPSMKLAGVAAFLAEKLRGGDLAAQIRLDELAPVVNTLRSDYAHDARVRDLVTMFAQARRLTGE